MRGAVLLWSWLVISVTGVLMAAAGLRSVWFVADGWLSLTGSGVVAVVFALVFPLPGLIWLLAVQVAALRPVLLGRAAPDQDRAVRRWSRIGLLGVILVMVLVPGLELVVLAQLSPQVRDAVQVSMPGAVPWALLVPGLVAFGVCQWVAVRLNRASAVRPNSAVGTTDHYWGMDARR